ncbi:MAG: 3-isopropylmalate dehydratase small subunit, partial [Nitrosopumilaceae archaeon]
LQDFGFGVIIAPSYADIFYSNCFKNGLLPIKLDSQIVDELIKSNSEIEVDLENQTIKTESKTIPFEIESFKKKILLEGLDDLALTFQYEDKIADFEKKSNVPSVL